MRVSVANVAMPSVMKTGITRMAADQHNTVLWHPNNKKPTRDSTSRGFYRIHFKTAAKFALVSRQT